MFSIETSRLILRDLLEMDFHPFYELCCEPEVTRFQDFLRVENADKALELLNACEFHNNVIPRRAYSLAIIRKQDLEWIGYIGFGRADDPSIGDMVFGYAIRKKYWGNGYMTEALQRVIDFCFKQLCIGKIYGGCDQENIASARVMQKAGLRLELSYQETDEDTGKISYAEQYSMIKDEWANKYPVYPVTLKLDG